MLIRTLFYKRQSAERWLNFFGNNLKILKIYIKKIPYFSIIIINLYNFLKVLLRIKDVAMMMILFHLWPEQTFRFSTRKVLPIKKNRFNKKERLMIPFKLIEKGTSKIKKMKEINVCSIGSSFDLNTIPKLKGPVFLVSYWDLLKYNERGDILYISNRGGFGHKQNKVRYGHIKGNFLKNGNNKVNFLKIYKNENLVYVNSSTQVIEEIKKENKTFTVQAHDTDEEGNYYPTHQTIFDETKSNLNDILNCSKISVVQNIYKSPVLNKTIKFPPCGSFLINLCALSFFAEKINVYGWDMLLDKSPDKMGYWELFFNMYKFTADQKRSGYNFEEALINFYYGYHLSNSNKFKIHSHMGKLKKHHKLIDRIERVIFN